MAEFFSSKISRMPYPAAPGAGPYPARVAGGLGAPMTAARRRGTPGQFVLLPDSPTSKDKLGPKEAAEHVGAQNLRALRRLMKTYGLPYVRVSPRKTIFVRAELDAWLEARKRK